MTEITYFWPHSLTVAPSGKHRTHSIDKIERMKNKKSRCFHSSALAWAQVSASKPIFHWWIATILLFGKQQIKIVDTCKWCHIALSFENTIHVLVTSEAIAINRSFSQINFIRNMKVTSIAFHPSSIFNVLLHLRAKLPHLALVFLTPLHVSP